MRKVLSFVLVLSLVLGSFAMAFAATPAVSDTAGKACEDAVNVLTELGVVKGYPDGSYKPENIVTRAEMAVIVISALGLKDYAVGTSSFKDMAGYDWAQGYVAYAQSLGVINGYPDGTFKPGKTVSYDEAATMLVGALGYNADSLVGTWPANYVTKAKTLGILDDVKAGITGANRGDIAVMTYQTLGCAMGKTNKDGDWVEFNLGTITNPVNDTMLKRLGAKEYAPLGLKAGDPFVLTKAIADTAVVNVYDYIGAYVSAYVNSDKEVIAIKEVKSKFLKGEITIAGGVITEIEVDDVEYTVNANDKYTDAGNNLQNSVTFVNGDDLFAAGLYTVANGDTVTIAAKVSGKTISNVYSILDWNINQSKKVKSSDLKAITASTPKLLSETFVLDDNKEIDTKAFQLVGVAKLADIAADNVVYVYKNASGISKVEVGTEVVKGEVTKVSSGGKFTIGGKAYEFSAKAALGRPGVGDVVEAYLDASGDIYFYEITEGVADDYAIVLRTGVADEDMTALGASDAELELFLADGTKKLFKVDYDAFDGTAIKVAVYNKNAGAPDTWGIGTGDVIQYDVNSDGEINAIEWMIDASTGPVLAAISGDAISVGSAMKVSKDGKYDGLNIADDAVIFTYDTLAGGVFSTKTDNYAVGKKAAFLDSTLTAVTAYVVDEGVIEFMYISDTVAVTDKVFGVLLDTATIGTKDPKYEAKMLVDGVEKVYPVKANILKQTVPGTDDYLKLGKLYQIDFAADGTTVSDLKDVAAVGDIKFKNVAALTNVTDTADVSGNVVKSLTNAVPPAASTFDVTTAAGATTTPSFITLSDNVVVYVKNSAGTKYELGTTSDIDGASAVVFYDVVGDGRVFDIVLVN